MFGYILIKEKVLQDLEARLKDVERHFVTKRNDKGEVTQTLADVPVDQRKPTKSLRGLSWPQRKHMLEETDGGRKPRLGEVS